MKKRKILTFGDFRESSDLDIASHIALRFSGSFEIVATGLGVDYLCDVPGISGCRSISEEAVYHQNTADVTIVTSPAFRYRKTKKDQLLITLIDHFDEKSFAGIPSDIDTVITRDKDTAAAFEKLFPFIKTTRSSGNMYEAIDREIEGFFRSYGSVEKDEYLFISIDSHYDFKRDTSGLSHLVDKLSSDPDASIYLLGYGENKDSFRTRFLPDMSKRTRAFLSNYDGKIVFCSDRSKDAFNDLVSGLGIEIKSSETYTPGDSIFLLTGEPLPSDSSRYTAYKRALKKAYAAQGCYDKTVSILICRYETSQELVERAVMSVFRAGHEKLDIIIIDDGSAVRLDTDSEILSDERVRYYYISENRGVSLARNEALEKAVGDYVICLDADDMLCEYALQYMLSHICIFDIPALKGNRVITEADGTPVSESFKDLSGDLFRIYFSDRTSNIYSDVMVTNLMFKKDHVTEHGIRFIPSYYEDSDFTARIFSTAGECHYINIPVHKWFKYGEGTTVSSHIDIRSLREKLKHIRLAWEAIPVHSRRERIRSLLTYDFNLFFSGWYNLNEEEQLDAWVMLRDFFAERAEWFDKDTYSERISALAKAFETDSYEFFEYVLGRYYCRSAASGPHNDYIVLNKDQLDDAKRRRANSDLPARLFLRKNGWGFDQKLIYELKRSDEFDLAKTFDDREVVSLVKKSMRKRPGDEQIVINDYHFAKYGSIFSDCDTAKDTLFVYSFYETYWHYVSSYFRKIKLIAVSDEKIPMTKKRKNILKSIVKKLFKNTR